MADSDGWRKLTQAFGHRAFLGFHCFQVTQTDRVVTLTIHPVVRVLLGIAGLLTSAAIFAIPLYFLWRRETQGIPLPSGHTLKFIMFAPLAAVIVFGFACYLLVTRRRIERDAESGTLAFEWGWSGDRHRVGFALDVVELCLTRRPDYTETGPNKPFGLRVRDRYSPAAGHVDIALFDNASGVTKMLALVRPLFGDAAVDAVRADLLRDAARGDEDPSAVAMKVRPPREGRRGRVVVVAGAGHLLKIRMGGMQRGVMIAFVVAMPLLAIWLAFTIRSMGHGWVARTAFASPLAIAATVMAVRMWLNRQMVIDARSELIHAGGHRRQGVGPDPIGFRDVAHVQVMAEIVPPKVDYVFTFCTLGTVMRTLPAYVAYQANLVLDGERGGRVNLTAASDPQEVVAIAREVADTIGVPLSIHEGPRQHDIVYERSDTIEKCSFSFEGCNIYYAEAGAGPPVLLLHGHCCGHEDWYSQLTGLIDDLHMLAPDMPYYGKSDIGPVPHDHAFSARAMWALLEHCGVEEVVLVAHSAGSMVAYEMIRQTPGLVRGFVFVDTGKACWQMPEAMRRERVAARTGVPQHLLDALKAMGRPLEFPSVSNVESLRAFDDAREVYHARVGPSEGLVTEPPGSNWTDKPALLFASGAGVATLADLPPGYMNKHAPSPNSKLFVVPDCGHWVMRDQPRIFNRELLAFVETLPT